jgi:hypothetical protein
MKKHELMTNLRRELQGLAQQRRAAGADPDMCAARAMLQLFQAARMAATHADLLAAPESAVAARFFLNDLYGSKDVMQRDADVERVLPTMERMLPLPALAAIAEAIELEALSETLDAALAARLGARFDEHAYAAAYRAAGARADRERQLRHVESVGNSLYSLVRVPLLGATLAMMRGPARLAGLSELQSFLERGFGAFKAMKRPQDFVAAVVARERRILDNLYCGRAAPFAL